MRLSEWENAMQSPFENAEPENLVPKVHPATRAVEPEDPMSLHATPAPGDPEVMLRCVVQEYAMMGMKADLIMTLFRDPYYPALNDLLSALGEAALRQRVDHIISQIGVFRYHVVEAPAEPEVPDLIELGISENIRPRARGAVGGYDHAEGL
jgi:hypothetical protein